MGHMTRGVSPAPSVPMRAPCVHVSLVTAGHNTVQGRRRGEDLVKPIIRERLCINGKLKRNMAEKPPIIGSRSQSLCPQSGGLQIWGTWSWCYNVTNIEMGETRTGGSKCQSLAPGYFGLLYSILRTLPTDGQNWTGTLGWINRYFNIWDTGEWNEWQLQEPK